MAASWCSKIPAPARSQIGAKKTLAWREEGLNSPFMNFRPQTPSGPNQRLFQKPPAKSKFLVIPATLAAAFLVGTSALAGTTAIPSSPADTVMTTTAGDWKITLGLYGWGAGLEGDIGAAGFVTPVDISFSKILDSLDMVAMGKVETRKNRWIFQLEGLYLRNSFTTLTTTPRGNLRNSNLTAETTRLQPVIGYRFYDNSCTQLDVLAGAVYYNISNELRVIGPVAQASVDSGDDWVDPIIGLRLTQRLGERWRLQMRGDVGGFGVNADLVWQAVGMVGFDMTESSTLFFGYRHAAVDYQNGGFVYDAASSGPLIGLSITW
jgi:hypothetical protein